MGKKKKGHKEVEGNKKQVNGEKSEVKCKGNVKGNNKPNELKEIIRGMRTKKITIDGRVKKKGKGGDQKKKGRKRENKWTWRRDRAKGESQKREKMRESTIVKWKKKR